MSSPQPQSQNAVRPPTPHNHPPCKAEIHPKAYLCAPTPLLRQEAFYVEKDDEQKNPESHQYKKEG